MNHCELFNLIQKTDVPLSVLCVHGDAADNAADTIIENGGKWEQGVFTDEFITIWIDSVVGILCEPTMHEKEAADWFAAHGVTA